jgi:hypothetical protein
MDLAYDLDSTTIVATEAELDQHRGVIDRETKAEEKRGRKVTVLVRFEIHEASDKQVEMSPRGRLFPRPLKNLGAAVPELVADKLKAYALERGQPMSDVTRVLYTEFLVAKKREGRGDGWTKFIEARLNDVRSLREDKKRISFARTKQVTVRKKKNKKKKKTTTSKKKTKKSTKRSRAR